MAALTTDRNTPRRHDRDIEEHPVAPGVTVFAGALTVLDTPTRLATPGRVAVGLLAVGRAEERVTGAADGSSTVRIRRGCHRFANSGGSDLVARADIGAQAFVVDDQTVAKTSAGGTRSAAGIIRDADAQGVWVEF